jgi:DNA-directed RNA polymerase subunit M
VKFCPECESLLSPQKVGKRRKLVCRACGYTRSLTSKIKASYRIEEKIDHGPKEETLVIDEKLAKQRPMPTVRAICPKCGHKVAYYWQVQTRSGDEGMTTFYRCCDCHQTWREY